MKVIITTVNSLSSFDGLIIEDFVNSRDSMVYMYDSTEKPIPQIGEKVSLFYTPHPTVKGVVYDYENSRVWVLVE